MKIVLHIWLLVSASTTIAVKDPPLPPCPTNLQYFPQSLPMHCRMPRSADPAQFPGFPTLPPMPESFYQSPPPDKQPRPIPIPIPPFPGMPGAMPMPGPMGPMGQPMPPGPMPPGAMPVPMPGGPMPMPMPMVGGPPHKLPVIVMPFYSPDNSFKKQSTPRPRHRHPKKKRPRKKRPNSHESNDETSSGEGGSGSEDSEDSSEHGFWKGRAKGGRRKMSRRQMSGKKYRAKRKEVVNNKKKELLTPILQYVTKDGYVIFEKQISKGEAKDWLKPPRPDGPEVNAVEEKHDEKINEVKPKSAEKVVKAYEEEEVHMRAEESKEAEAITQKPSIKVKPRHRPRKPNPLIKGEQ
ncbi:hypothetical protein B5X24_HaOG205594 [Helicoverpa armigera]|uniref:Uncharacterized protein n=1 Tax=Helicoverpa armigera TaxID=29058 RepID=A0A2W1BSW5_HELAM|nr:hypothetical protein B5X24_HaOG205594 [Helicoverpa armigera]